MEELRKVLNGDGYGTPPARILAGLSAELALSSVPGMPHTIYAEVWHLCFWLERTLAWISDWHDQPPIPYPAHASEGFPPPTADEPWPALHDRFLQLLDRFAALAVDTAHLTRTVRIPSRPGHPIRIMSLQERLINEAAHNAYHLGRVVSLRQMLHAWPPPGGGDIW
jgi:hypothetical protein